MSGLVKAEQLTPSSTRSKGAPGEQVSIGAPGFLWLDLLVTRPFPEIGAPFCGCPQHYYLGPVFGPLIVGNSHIPCRIYEISYTTTYDNRDPELRRFLGLSWCSHLERPLSLPKITTWHPLRDVGMKTLPKGSLPRPKRQNGPWGTSNFFGLLPWS